MVMPKSNGKRKFSVNNMFFFLNNRIPGRINIRVDTDTRGTRMATEEEVAPSAVHTGDVSRQWPASERTRTPK